MPTSKSPLSATQVRGLSPKKRGSLRAARKPVVIAGTVVLAGAVGFGVDQLLSSSPSSPPHAKRTSNSRKSPNGTLSSTIPPSILANGLSPAYLAQSADALVGIELSQALSGLSGTATVVAATGQAPSRGEDFVSYTVDGSLNGATLSIRFNGGKPSSAALTGASFGIDFHLPTGITENLTFSRATPSEIRVAQARFVQSLEPIPSRTPRPSAPRTTPGAAPRLD